jgi:hypothetical protein
VVAKRDRTKRVGGLALVGALVMLVGPAGSAPAAASGPRLSWTRVQPPEMANSIVRDVTSNGGTVLAVGSTDFDAGVWTSSDAKHWSRVDLGAVGVNTVLQAATAWHQGFAAVGVHYTFATTGIQRDAVALTSADGRNWQRLDLPGGHGAFPNSIAVHRGALVAGGCAGVVTRGGCLFAKNAQAVLWTSANARSWTRRLLPDGEHSFVHAMTSIGDTLVLVGTEVSVDESGFFVEPVAVAVWEGPTPAHEQRIRNQALDSGWGMGVVGVRGTYLAVGSGATCAESWKRTRAGWATVDDSPAECDQQMADAVVFHGAAYATGFNYFYDRMPVWSTRDTRSWTAITDSTMQSDALMLEGTSMIDWQGRLVIAGTGFTAVDPPVGMFWLGTPGR